MGQLGRIGRMGEWSEWFPLEMIAWGDHSSFIATCLICGGVSNELNKDK